MADLVGHLTKFNQNGDYNFLVNDFSPRYYLPILSDPTDEDTDDDGIIDNNDSTPLNAYRTKSLWKKSDEKYSTPLQTEFLKLHLAWYLAETDVDKIEIEDSAAALRKKASSGIPYLADKLKVISGAAADEFSWGDAGESERDYWLYEVNKVSPEIIISKEKTFHAILFIASIISPSPDDAYRIISKKAEKVMLDKVGEKGAKKFIKASTKFAAKKGENGIKKLSGKGIKGCTHEVKVIGKKEGAYRLLGKENENGELIWEFFEKTHH